MVDNYCQTSASFLSFPITYERVALQNKAFDRNITKVICITISSLEKPTSLNNGKINGIGSLHKQNKPKIRPRERKREFIDKILENIVLRTSVY